MSDAVNQFLEHARSGDEIDPRIKQGKPRITLDGQSTFSKMCPVCLDHMPHVRREDFSECVVCGNRTYNKRTDAASGQGSE